MGRCQWDSNANLKDDMTNAIMRPGHPFLKSGQNGELGIHLPSKQEFSVLMADAGIDADTQVICYDEWDNHFATRLWWVMHYYGYTNVRLLNGGWQAWVAAGLPVSITPVEGNKKEPASAFDVDPCINITLEELMDKHDDPDWQVWDVRRISEFDGSETEQNSRVGHIPGAVHLEWKRLLSKAADKPGVNYFMPREQMQALLDQKGITKDKTIVVHCQAGVRASFSFFCLTMLGYSKVKLYDGSMAEWANVEHTPLVA
jgi:thiosulfate/3-mercaptopyruvate sulfurtransferase